MDFISEASRIKDRLRSCESVREISAVADDERATVREMFESEGVGKLLADQIIELKRYRIDQLNRKRGR